MAMYMENIRIILAFVLSICSGILFDGGYISANGGYVSNNVFRPYTFHYHYYCKDHLGNNRVVVDEDGEIEQVTHYYPYGGLYGDVNTESGLQPPLCGGEGKEFRNVLNLCTLGVSISYASHLFIAFSYDDFLSGHGSDGYNTST